VIVRVSLVGLAAAITCTGVAFSGVALFYVFLFAMNPAAAAGLTALVLFAAAGIVVLIFLAARPASVTLPAPATARPHENALVPALSELAKEHPFVAIGCALALGISDAMQRRPTR